MENIGKEYKNILSRLEERLKDNPDLEYVKSEFTNLFMMCFNEIDSLRVLYEEKIETILDRQSYFDKKIAQIEETTEKLKEEILYDEEDDEYIREMLNAHGNHEEGDDDYEECEIHCPYCGELFFIGADVIKKEIDCPYCTNLIELDWEEIDEDDLRKRKNNGEDK